MTCSRCHFVVYCSEECEKQDWIAFHSRECHKLAKAYQGLFSSSKPFVRWSDNVLEMKGAGLHISLSTKRDYLVYLETLTNDYLVDVSLGGHVKTANPEGPVLAAFDLRDTRRPVDPETSPENPGF